MIREAVRGLEDDYALHGPWAIQNWRFQTSPFYLGLPGSMLAWGEYSIWEEIQHV